MAQVLGFIGGLAFFLYGITLMGRGLSELAGGRFSSLLARMCRTPLRGMIFGALLTAAIQSSSATTVMVVGFVNGEMMTLSHAVGVIIGANLGTTVTSWLLSLTGVSGDNLLLYLLSPEALSPILAALGTAMLLFSRREKLHRIGAAIAGFGILLSGMEGMSNAVAPLAGDPRFVRILTVFEHPLAGLLAGVLLTAIIQSSSASVGILQALCVTGSVTLGMAVPIVMGQNIGTCVTALLSSVGAGVNARRAAFLHLYFNVTGTALLLTLFYLLRLLGLRTDTVTDAAGVALIHTAFNVAATVLLLPCSSLLLRLVVRTVPDREEEKRGADRAA
ncbi:MAG: Na/Pi cotransporter family protein [Ruminococcaceae bacterium]|nr:Na/Pi cotransporter family protein [Oscillospiraceae bacterium]